MAKIGILRVDPDLRDEAKKVAKKMGITLARFTERALKELIVDHLYDYVSLMTLVEKTPTLALHHDVIAKELRGAPKDLIKKVMKMIDEGEVRFYKIILEDGEKEKLEKILIEKSKDALLIFKLEHDEKEPNESLSEFIGELNLEKKKIKVVLKHSFDVGKKSELLAFILYKKESEGNGKT